MDRKMFHEAFRKVVNSIDSDNKFNDLASILKISIPTVRRWYDGASAPAKVGREITIKYLYEEQEKKRKKKEFSEQVKEVIKENLKIKAVGGSYSNSADITIEIFFGDELISTAYADIEFNSDCGEYGYY